MQSGDRPAVTADGHIAGGHCDIWGEVVVGRFFDLDVGLGDVVRLCRAIA